MKPKTILVCLTNERFAEATLKAAIVLARQHEAHLIGLHVMESLIVHPGIATHVAGPVMVEFDKSQNDQAERLKDLFLKLTDPEDFVSEWRKIRVETSIASDRIIESARAADLVVFGQVERGWERGSEAITQDRVIRECGRPVLMVPDGQSFERLGEKILFGWSATREATRAVHDALHLAKPGAEIFILRIGRKTDDELNDHAANELAEACSRHGFKASIIHRTYGGGQSVAEILCQVAHEHDADMIATGAFGHSALYDFVIGAATRELLENADLPALYSK